eukprot:jgi/Orpsp1_1/1180348/evm.model.c7180000073047.1
MPFGLTGAPATFQREMNRILFPLIGKCVYNFIDDILIYSKTIEEHLEHIKQVLSILEEHKLKINIEKCSFMQSEVEVLGHKVSAEGLSPLDNKVQNVKYTWKNDQETSFNTLKERLINAPILKFPNFEKEFIIRTDASYDGFGGVLLQKDDESGKEHPIHYISRSLTKAEKNYARHTRWCMTVSTLKIDLRYETGKKNVIADALSRMKTEKDQIALATKIIKEKNEDLLSKVIKEFIEEKFTTIDGVDYFIDGNHYRKLVTDTKEKLKLIFEAHEIGHEGYYKTYQRLRKSYYWNDMVNDIKRIISKCEKCQLNRSKPYPEPTEDNPTKVEGPFTHLGLDIIGPLEKTRNNN